jgi:hypothetical protein
VNFEQTRLTIGGIIANEWDKSYPLFAENIGEQSPTGPWARWSLRPISTTSIDISAKTQHGARVEAFLWFQFFCVEANGTTDAMKFADKIAAMFDERWQTIPSTTMTIRFRRTELAYVGLEPSGRLQWRITVRYRVDEL